MAYVYALFEPDSEICHYVGLSKKPKGRLSSHINEALHGRNQNDPDWEWLRNLTSHGGKPRLVILEQLPRYEGGALQERYWIHRMINEGHPLSNKAVLAPDILKVGVDDHTVPPWPLYKDMVDTIARLAEDYGVPPSYLVTHMLLACLDLIEAGHFRLPGEDGPFERKSNEPIFA